jgi:flagellar assembly protein FliH
VAPIDWPSVGNESSNRKLSRSQADSGPGLSASELEKRTAEVSAQADARVAQARNAGYADGERAARAEIQPVLERLSKSLQSLSAVRGQLRKQAEEDLVKLTIAIARRVLRRELTVDADALQGIVTAALDRLQTRDISRVRLHPSQEATVRRYLESAGVPGIEILADSSLNAGDLIFDTTRGVFEASIESQLREIERGFADALPR